MVGGIAKIAKIVEAKKKDNNHNHQKRFQDLRVLKQANCNWGFEIIPKMWGSQLLHNLKWGDQMVLTRHDNWPHWIINM